jgi:hypothetical protein
VNDWNYYDYESYYYYSDYEEVAGTFLEGEYINTDHAGEDSETAWHFVYIYEWDGSLWWENNAGYYWKIVYDEDDDTLVTGEGCPYGEGLDIEMSESWDGERGDLFMTLTFNGEPYLEYNHYEWYEAQYGDEFEEEEEEWYDYDEDYDEDYDSYYDYSEYYYYSEDYYYYSEDYDEDYYFEEEEEEVLEWADLAEAELSENWVAV